MDIAIHLVANKWTIQILRELLSGPKRPLDLERTLTGISAKTLAERLYYLQSAGLISRVSFPEVPPRVEYSLTPLGREMEVLMLALKKFGEKWMSERGVSEYNDTCTRCLTAQPPEVCPAIADLTPVPKKVRGR